jgi:1-acyl-sn-glycerol-3-phosphate acyltransferase
VRKVIDWVFTIPFLILLVLALVVCDPLFRLSRLFGVKSIGYVASAFMWMLQRLIFPFNGTRTTVEKSRLVKPRAPYIIISNHQSLYEFPLFGTALFSNIPGFISKVENGKWYPTVSFYLRNGPCTLIDRNDRTGAIRAIADLGRRAQDLGHSVLIYPEGTRAKDGELKQYKKAGSLALLAAAPDLEVLPVAVEGGWIAMRNNFLPVPFGTRMRIRVGDPIARRPDEDGEAIVEQAHAFARRALAEWRGIEAGNPPGF